MIMNMVTSFQMDNLLSVDASVYMYVRMISLRSCDLCQHNDLFKYINNAMLLPGLRMYISLLYVLNRW